MTEAAQMEAPVKKAKPDIKRSLEIESEIARSLLVNIHTVIADDEDLALNTIEGETSLIETIKLAVERIADIEAFREATKARRDALKAREDRLAKQQELLRTALVAAMGAVEMKKLELPAATLTIKAVPPKATIVSEVDIPSNFWKPQDPKLDLKAITDALKAKETVPGATLSNGGETIQIRYV